MYIPKPIGTSGVNLPRELIELVDKLAENAHDIWAQRRIREGWSYGARRDDITRQHPDLVPFSQLTNSEKEYDRSAVEGTLKAIIALGYKIQKT